MSNVEDPKTMDLYSLIRALNYYRKDFDCNELDSLISEKLKDITDLHYFAYWAGALSFAPKTVVRLNQLVLEYLKAPESQVRNCYSDIQKMKEYLCSEVKETLTNSYLDGTLKGWYGCIFDFIVPEGKRNLELLDKFITGYKGSIHYIDGIHKAFKNLSANDLNSGCKLISDSTPNVQSTLLIRQDIEEEYVLKGLKAIGKLKAPKNIKVKIKLDLLKRISPKGRLEVVKHIIGSGYRYRWYKDRLVEFEVLPTKEELSEVLFSCSMEMYKEVSEILRDFDLYLQKIKEKEKEEEKEDP